MERGLRRVSNDLTLEIKNRTMLELAEHEIVNRFIQHLSAGPYPGLKLTSRPDETERNQPAVDAIAEPLAIEHASIGTFLTQRQEDAWWRDIKPDLEERLPERIEGVNGHVVYVCLCPGTLKKADQQRFVSRLAEWFIDNQLLIQKQRQTRVPSDALSSDPEAPVVIIQHYACGQGEVYCGIATDSRPNTQATAELAQELKAPVDRKASKLMPHKEAGRTCVLLLENRDVFHMNKNIMLEAVFQAYPEKLPPGIDELWYVEGHATLAFHNFTEPQLRNQEERKMLSRAFNGPSSFVQLIPSV